MNKKNEPRMSKEQNSRGRTKKAFKYVFIVVVYRNGEDLYEFNKSVTNSLSNYKVVIINSYYDEKTKKRIAEIANELSFDFINIDNKGYGYGNNKGIEYANKEYTYDYLIISNSDIEIKEFDENSLEKNSYICGPEINTMKGKKQNPYQAIKSDIILKLYYYGYNKKKIVLAVGIAINKMLRMATRFMHFHSKKPYATYAIHGSFVVFSQDIIKDLAPIYDENMFLYNEERLLAYKLRCNNIECYVNPKIQVIHKEDGSTKGTNINTDKYIKESFNYFYKKYIAKKVA